MKLNKYYTFGLALCLIAISACSPRPQTAFHVAPNALEKGKGTIQSPFRTIEAAQKAVAGINKKMREDIVIYLHAGTYMLSSPLVFNEEDSGNNGFKIIYKAYQDEKPIISGGTKVSGWKKHKGNIYIARFNSDKKLRQLYVNDKRCYMARGPEIGQDDGSQWSKFVIRGTEPWAYGPGEEPDGVIFHEKSNLPLFKNPELVELHSLSGFAYHIVELRDIITAPEGNVAEFQQPMGAIAASIPEEWGCGLFKNLHGPERLFHFENAMELLDEPGEFYFDVYNKKLYYFKRPEENLSTANVVAPVSEGLITIKGNTTDSHVSNIRFEGITFSHDHWRLAEIAGSRGLTTVQSVSLYIEYIPGGNWHEYKYQHMHTQQATVEVANADHISFVNNTFEHLGAIAINMGNDVTDCKVSCNVFQDLGSASINVGDARNIYIGDGDIEQEGLSKNILITNNYIVNCGMEHLAAPGISVLWAENCQILHNHIEGTPYSGISLGWGWTNFAGYNKAPASTVSKNNKINYNTLKQIALYTHDGGAIYTLGAQPGGEIIGNYVDGVVCPSSGNSIYLDQGTSDMLVKNNVSKNFAGSWFFVWGKDAKVKRIVAENNYTDDLKGTEFKNTWESLETGTYTKWSEEAKRIVDNSGVEEGCRKKNIVSYN